MLHVLIKNHLTACTFLVLLALVICSVNCSQSDTNDEDPLNSAVKLNEESESSINGVRKILNKIFEGIDRDLQTEFIRFNQAKRYHKVNRREAMNERNFMFNRRENRKISKKSAIYPPWRFPINVLKWSTPSTIKSNAPQEMFDQLSIALHS